MVLGTWLGAIPIIVLYLQGVYINKKYKKVICPDVYIAQCANGTKRHMSRFKKHASDTRREKTTLSTTRWRKTRPNEGAASEDVYSRILLDWVPSDLWSGCIWHAVASSSTHRTPSYSPRNVSCYEVVLTNTQRHHSQMTASFCWRIAPAGRPAAIGPLCQIRIRHCDSVCSYSAFCCRSHSGYATR